MFSLEYLLYECCVCGNLIEQGERADIHEIVVTRGDVSGSSPEIKLAIHDPRNCGFVHRECHDKANEYFLTCLAYLIKYEGVAKVSEFISEIGNLGYTHPRMRKALHILEEYEEES